MVLVMIMVKPPTAGEETCWQARVAASVQAADSVEAADTNVTSKTFELSACNWQDPGTLHSGCSVQFPSSPPQAVVLRPNASIARRNSW